MKSCDATWTYGLLADFGAFACALYTALRPRGRTRLLDEAFADLYNFDFPAAHQAIDRYIAEHPQEPLPYAVRASGYLFYELDRWGFWKANF